MYSYLVPRPPGAVPRRQLHGAEPVDGYQQHYKRNSSFETIWFGGFSPPSTHKSLFVTIYALVNNAIN